jgi:transposase
VLFETNIGNAGELIDSILHKRAKDCTKPMMMSDALASNRRSGCEVVMTLCNSHARRQLVEVISHFPKEVEHVLNRYGYIWANDQHSKAQQHSPNDRLPYHQEYSRHRLQK